MQTPETKFQKGFRITTGVLMTLQTITFFFISGFLFIFILLMGGLATIASGGNATMEQLKTAWWAIGFMAVYPEVVAILMIITCVQIFLRRRSIFIITTCLLFVLPYLGMLFVMLNDEEMKKAITAAALLPVAIPLMAIFVALQMRQKTATVAY